MVIGIIGSGISGLVAGRLLSQAGHEVTIFERDRTIGGKLSTLHKGKENKTLLDNRIACFPASDPVFKEFVDELAQKNIVNVWTNSFPFHDGREFYQSIPGKEYQDYYIVPDGMNKIIQYLSRWVDIEPNESVGGFTYIGNNRHKKKAWMLNLSNAEVWELDAIIIATPAIVAYGLIDTAQDETVLRKMIPVLDKIEYDNCFTLAAGYGEIKQPNFKGVECKHSDVSWISNESSKRDNPNETALVIHSSNDFFHNHRYDPEEKVVQHLLQVAADLTESWIDQPEWTQLDQWMYKSVRNPLPDPFVEVKSDNEPLALIGDYFGGDDVEAAYLSGYKLAKHWLEKYPVK